MRDPKERLQDIIESIEAINRYSHLSRSEVAENELVQVWFHRHLQIIGEAARALPPSVREIASDIPWSKIIGMRNILVHNYFKIDFNTLWGAVQEDIPALATKITKLLSQLEEIEYE